MPPPELSGDSTTVTPPPPPLQNNNTYDLNQQHHKNNIINSTTNITNEEPQDSDESAPSSPGGKDEFVLVKLSEIRKEVQCPICLGIIQKTRTVMECLHRFCRGCIDKAMRLGNNECPACRTHCASRRSLRDDPNYDALIAALCPDIKKYEEEELAFHEEEKARNKLIQTAIAETVRRQTEALGRKRTRARAAAAFMKRSQGSYRNLRGRKKHRIAEHRGSDDDEDVNVQDFGNSSADERSTEVKRKRRKGGLGTRSSALDAEESGHDSDVEVKRESIFPPSGLFGSFEILSWGKGGTRSHHRLGNPNSGTGRLPRNNHMSKLIDHLRCADQSSEGLDISLRLVTLHEDTVPSLQRPYICSRPALSVKHLCQYVAMHTSMQANEIEMVMIKDLELPTFSADSINESQSLAIDPSKCEMHLLEEHQTLAEIQSLYIINQQNLVLAYRLKATSLQN
ncbi:hypothetical protein LIER_06307 [Lithospermum erythrorhizon]|uniref:RING-type domain-containing protein n=1 Tax=Lithospermum erythrorhizon TaxID=34254 RepID=A0AAV3P5K8_LITER